MADAKPVYPQIPSTVWWGLRDQFKKTIPNKVTDSYLVVQLNVQATAAKAYLSELKRVGLLDPEGRPTEAAKKWRLDDSYREAADQMLRAAYPDELIDVAPPTDSDRSKAVRWFMEAVSLGEGAAKNKAATYFLIGGNAPPSDAAPKATASKPNAAKVVQKKAPSKKEKSKGGGGGPAKPSDGEPPTEGPGSLASSKFPLNVNVQIHISADATGDQIEAIFSNMKKCLS